MNISELTRNILSHRGVEGADAQFRFLNPKYEDLHDPFLLPGVMEAVKRIEKAIDRKEAVVIYGDYDIDGLSATALLLDALGAMGAGVDSYIPDRFEEGYGINTAALKRLKGMGADLVITVDCGSTSHQPLEWAAKNGLDVIVTDHHNVGETLPPAVAIINPKRADSSYPFTDLAGVGVAFKLVQALQQSGRLQPGREKWLLDLVALGTVCDVVGLVDENRILVTYGLKVFARTPRVGLQALMAVAGVEPGRVDTHHFGFALGPRLNAAGRLEHAKLALRLFTTTDKVEALEIARHLDRLNAERRRQQDIIMEMALSQADERSEDPVLVLSHPEWNHGIVGIVAAKLVERFHKPVIVLQEVEGEAKGSARSLGGFSMVEAMRSADDLLIKYGGHHVAAGCTLAVSDLPGFRDRLRKYYKANGFGDLRATPQADVRLEGLEHMNRESLDEMSLLAPFGMGNPRPLLYLPGAKLARVQRVGADKRHARLVIGDGRNELAGIGFGQADKVEEAGGRADVWFELDLNEFRGVSSLQANIKAVLPCKD